MLGPEVERLKTNYDLYVKNILYLGLSKTNKAQHTTANESKEYFNLGA